MTLTEIMIETAGLVFVTIAVMCDMLRGKVSNFFFLSCLLIDFFCVFLFGRNILDMFLGLVIPILILWILFVFRIIGAGDIKLFCVLGACIGINELLACMLFSFLWAGLIALVHMINRHRLQKGIIAGLKTTYGLIRGQIMAIDIERDGLSLMPFTVAALFGYVTWLIWRALS